MSKLDRDKLNAALSQIINRYKLTELGAFYHQFDGGGITGLVSLAESHIAVHTWPELRYVTLDVYICNYQRDNSVVAEQLHDSLVSIFSPSKVEIRRIFR